MNHSNSEAIVAELKKKKKHTFSVDIITAKH